jgi:hypothetical protein
MSWIVVNSKLNEDDGTACLVAYRLIEILEEMQISKLVVIGSLHFKPTAEAENLVHVIHYNSPSSSFNAKLAPIPASTPIRDGFLSSLINFLQVSSIPTEVLIVRGYRFNGNNDSSRQAISSLMDALASEISDWRDSVVLDERALDSLESNGWAKRSDDNLSMFG